MARIERRGQRWRASVRLNGQKSARTFRKKGEANAWSAQNQSDILL